MSKTVIGVFESFGNASAALDALESSDLPHEGVKLQSSADFVAGSQLPPADDESAELRRGLEQFMAEIGLTAPRTLRPIEPDDGILMVVAPNDGADAIAQFLDEQGAIDIDARAGRATDDGPDEHRASGLEAKVGGRTPPGMQKGVPGWTGSNPTAASAAEHRRTEAERASRQTCARIFNC